MLPAFQAGETARVTPDHLAVPKARQLAALVARGLPFARLIRAERHIASGYEAVVLEVDVELCQRTVQPIQRIEPLAFIFDPEDRLRPEVLALRPGFPITPHQNLSTRPEPRSLCLYEEPYADQKTRWSAFGFLERAREWLRLAARGELHQEDQPLEPLLAQTANTAILPHDFFTSITGKDLIPTVVARTSGADEHFILVFPQADWPERQAPDFVLSPFVTPAVEHGIITHQPANLFQLQEFCQKAPLDLVQALRERIRAWKTAGNLQHLATSKLILCLVFPKARHAASAAESRDIWLFATHSSLLEVGVAVGILEVKSGLAGLVIPETQAQTAAVGKIEILPMRPTFTLNASSAAILNGTSLDQTRIVAVGLGAVGSHVFDNLLKSGFGSWTLVDNDCLLPHNCARHVLDGDAVTHPKAVKMCERASAIVPDLPVKAIIADVLNPGNQIEPLASAYKDAEVILDMSASTAVAKYLALDVSVGARRASIFLNPTGDTLIALVEDKERALPLDCAKAFHLLLC